MSKHLPFILIVSLFLTALLLSISAQDQERINCDGNRQNAEECENLPYTTTCAYYKDCPTKKCGYNAGNGCYACSDSAVLYYENHTCNESEVINKCYDDPSLCNLAFDSQALKAYDPTCGISADAKRKTYDNYCLHCTGKGTNYFQSGPCEEDRHICLASDRNKNCTNEKYNPVCAHFETEIDFTTYTNVSNGCAACADEAVDYYIEGECGPLRDSQTYCLPNNRPEVCTPEWNPVCGYYQDKYGNLKYKIEANPTCACADESIIYHIPGPCLFYCDPDACDCEGTDITPICGTYIEDDGKMVNVSLKNICMGCFYPGRKIDFYVEGLCPGDEGIYCKNHPDTFIVGLISAACGLTKEGCNDTSCATSFTEAEIACSDNSTLLFKAGLCPGDEGFSCDPFRPAAIKLNPALSETTYLDVCGYTEFGCKDKSCRKHYEDQNVACADEKVIFFTEGRC